MIDDMTAPDSASCACFSGALCPLAADMAEAKANKGELQWYLGQGTQASVFLIMEHPTVMHGLHLPLNIARCACCGGALCTLHVYFVVSYMARLVRAEMMCWTQLATIFH